MAKGAQGGRPRVSDEAVRTATGKTWTEWLAVLEQKTRGNLSFEETDLLSRALYELRMAYVEAVRPPGREPPPRAGG